MVDCPWEEGLSIALISLILLIYILFLSNENILFGQ